MPALLSLCRSTPAGSASSSASMASTKRASCSSRESMSSSAEWKWVNTPSGGWRRSASRSVPTWSQRTPARDIPVSMDRWYGRSRLPSPSAAPAAAHAAMSSARCRAGRTPSADARGSSERNRGVRQRIRPRHPASRNAAASSSAATPSPHGASGAAATPSKGTPRARHTATAPTPYALALTIATNGTPARARSWRALWRRASRSSSSQARSEAGYIDAVTRTS